MLFKVGQTSEKLNLYSTQANKNQKPATKQELINCFLQKGCFAVEVSGLYDLTPNILSGLNFNTHAGDVFSSERRERNSSFKSNHGKPEYINEISWQAVLQAHAILAELTDHVAEAFKISHHLKFFRKDNLLINFYHLKDKKRQLELIGSHSDPSLFSLISNGIFLPSRKPEYWIEGAGLTALVNKKETDLFGSEFQKKYINQISTGHVIVSPQKYDPIVFSKKVSPIEHRVSLATQQIQVLKKLGINPLDFYRLSLVHFVPGLS